MKKLIYVLIASAIYELAPDFAPEFSALLAAWLVFALIVFAARLLRCGIGRLPRYGSSPSQTFFSREDVAKTVQDGLLEQQNGKYGGWL